MKWNIVFGSVGMASVAMASAALAGDKTKSEQAFDRLSSLEGEWNGQIDGVNTTLIYTLTANGSALMEQCRPEKRPEMITMFTMDGDHRCSEAVSILACPRYRPEITGRFLQYRPYAHPGRQ